MTKRMPPASARAVLARSGGLCERCGRAGEQLHHRRPRGMGGTSDPAIHDPSNLVHLCAECHRWVESRRAVAVACGWLVTGVTSPADTPLFVAPGWFRVTADALVPIPTEQLAPPF